tara:strand:- start:428 stop:1276 length:849 start_codon:yes stop_codon:yes gene_type:complete
MLTITTPEVSKLTLLLKKSKSVSEAKPNTKNEHKDAKVLPFDVVKQYLLNHPAISCYNYSEKLPEIYNSIYFFISGNFFNVESSYETEKKVCKREYDCKECKKGFYLVDVRCGTLICEHCGLCVQNNINIEPEFITPPVFDYRRQGKRIPGVTKKTLEINFFMGNENTKKSLLSYLEHANTFFGIASHDLNMLDGILKNNTNENSHNLITKMLGIMFAFILKEYLYDEHMFRECIKKNKIFTMKIGPEPKFKCKNCGVKCFTWKDSRFHCFIERKNKRFKSE